MNNRWQYGKRFLVKVQDYNGHVFLTPAKAVDAITVGKAIRLVLVLENSCLTGCTMFNARVHSRSPKTRTFSCWSIPSKA